MLYNETMPSPSINLIKSSDGTGNAAMATVQSTRAPGASTILVDTVDNIPATFYGAMGTPHTFVDPITAETITVISEATARDFQGHVDGTNLEIDAMAPGNTDLGSSAGDVIIIKPTTEWANNIATTFAVAHNDDGSLKAVVSNQGWTDVTGTTVTATTANGNRSYDLTVDQDLRTVLSPGMRLRTTRTVAAPTQCTSLNGTTQYYSCPSATVAADMTFTDDFVAGAWVKLSAYQVSAVISRVDATTVANGWELQIGSDGRVALIGRNAGNANFSFVQSYQSLPLNKWVFVAAQLDMSSFTASTTTSYIMFDGVDVPCTVSRAGTNPTALVQSGNLNIGAIAGGAEFFPGKIAQPFVSSAKITQANIKTLYSQGLTPALITANSIISAYSFDNAITDLNTTSANNLTANGSAVATNADSPFGGQADGTISSTLDHAIIQKVTASTITVQVAEGCTIPTTGGVSAVSYSTQKTPFGFPGQRDKWVLKSIMGSQVNSGAIATTAWSNVGSWKIDVPVGAFTIGYQASIQQNPASGNNAIYTVTLSTNNTGETDELLTARQQTATASTISAHQVTVSRNKDVLVSAVTPYYCNQQNNLGVNATQYVRGDDALGVIFAENTYL